MKDSFQKRTFLLAVARDAIDKPLLGLIIQGDVTGHRAGAEHANFAHSFRADPADGQIGHTPIGEPQTRIGDVLRRAQDGNAHRIHARYRRFHESQHHVQIVDHQVQHDPDVRAARRVRRKPVSFDKPGLGGNALQVLENRIESFDVADLQDALVLLRQLDQLRCLRCVVGHRLLHQHMSAPLQKGFGQLEMRGCRRYNAQRVAGLHRLGEGIERAHSIFLRQFLHGLVGDIVEPDELHFAGRSQLAIDPHMLLAQRAGAQHRHSHLARRGRALIGNHRSAFCHCLPLADN